MNLIKELARRTQYSSLDTAELGMYQETASNAAMAFTQITMLPNIYGGMDEYCGSVRISSSYPNIQGGFNKTIFSLNENDNIHAFDHFESALTEILDYDGSSESEP